MRLAAVFFCVISFSVAAQSPQVPHKMHVAGITLSIRDDARREIQKDVDALTQYPKYFNIKVERARTYFPIIEKVFQEERVPDDFKFLVLQESALIPDAVSVSNAVGFWQFKDFTAMEMGLRVDKEIDERMNIVSATRAAAKYIKKNNFYFNNWIYALQAYQMGAGAVMQTVKDYESGTKSMEITSKTYWYVKKFLAHKVAFEASVKGAGEVKVVTYENRHYKTLHEVAREMKVDEQQLLDYNKWVRKTHIPSDRVYAVAIPVEGEGKAVYESIAKVSTSSHTEANRKIDARPAIASANETKYWNGLPAIKAGQNETPTSLAKRAGVGLSFFLKCNDLSVSDRIQSGDYYYTQKKGTKSSALKHIAVEGENLWIVSQNYGIQLKRLKKLNPGITSTLRAGTTVHLSNGYSQKAQEPVITEVVELDAGQSFNWSANTGSSEPLVQIEEQAKTEWSAKADTTSLYPVASMPDQHVVVAGETLYSIAKRYGVGVMDLVNTNHLKLENGIKPGQVLKMESNEEGSADSIEEKFVIYEIKTSDTLYSVAREHGVTIKQLMDWNGKKDFGVTTGEKLKILRQ